MMLWLVKRYRGGGQQRVYLSVEPTLVWNCFWIVWVGVVERGGTLPLD
jgi:hypothetical protein